MTVSGSGRISFQTSLDSIDFLPCPLPFPFGWPSLSSLFLDVLYFILTYTMMPAVCVPHASSIHALLKMFLDIGHILSLNHI